MPGDALLRLANEFPLLGIAVLFGALGLFALGMTGTRREEEKTVVLVDDDLEVHKGLKSLIESQRNLRIVGDAYDGAEGVMVVDMLQPDLVVMDVVMPRMDGVEATRRIKQLHPHIHVMAFGGADEDPTGRIMAGAGAEAFAVKGDPPRRILHALRTAA